MPPTVCLSALLSTKKKWEVREEEEWEVGEEEEWETLFVVAWR
jgi:hypothetical protein